MEIIAAMISEKTSRRQVLSLGVMSGVAAVLGIPASGAGLEMVPGLEVVMDRVRRLSQWVSIRRKEDGALELHCGTTDLGAWAQCSGRLAGGDIPVRAAGNTLSFQYHGQTVRVVMHPLKA